MPLVSAFLSEVKTQISAFIPFGPAICFILLSSVVLLHLTLILASPTRTSPLNHFPGPPGWPPRRQLSVNILPTHRKGLPAVGGPVWRRIQNPSRLHASTGHQLSRGREADSTPQLPSRGITAVLLHVPHCPSPKLPVTFYAWITNSLRLCRKTSGQPSAPRNSTPVSSVLAKR